MNMKAELKKLREAMKAHGFDWYIVPTNDFHGSEFINEYFKGRKYVSGFTGSAGTLVVSEKDARLWTDGRYFLQAAQQLEGSGIELMKQGQPDVPSPEEFLKDSIVDGMTLAFDGRVISAADGKIYEEICNEKQASIVYDVDLINEIWEDRPELIGAKIVNYPLSYAGVDSSTKITRVRYVMDEEGFEYHLIPGLEENAWLYNLRGEDVESSPVFFSFTLITPTKVYLYGFKNAFENVHLPQEVVLKDYFDIFEDLKKIPEGSRILAPFDVASYTMARNIPEGVEIRDGRSPVTSFKAVKNSVEISSTRHAHIEDGIAMVKFLSWFDKIEKEAHTELTVSDRLESFRREGHGFRGLSFETIAGYGPNGAIVHYAPTLESATQLKPEGFLLLDSGGQYLNGTTDITRTLVCGELSYKMKEYYTAVLKSHITLATQVFKPGTTGTELDVITRKPLQDIGLDYNHGTGHGVGHYLSVHEGPNNISPRRGAAPIYPNMITTDEPGVYIENEFGIRLENELLCVKSGDADFAFEPITLCPFDRRAILPKKLSSFELRWINSYHKRVYNTLQAHLDDSTREWLKKMTEPIVK